MRAQEISNHDAKLTINIPFELHRIIKTQATLNNSSIKDYVLDALQIKLHYEPKTVKNSAKTLTKKTKAASKQILNERVANILTNADKIGKKTFKDVDSVMKYLLQK
jgi:hypothetical protein